MKKNIKQIILVITAVFIFMALTACMDKKPKQYRYEFFDTFDTIVQVIGYSESEKEFSNYAKYTHDRFSKLHKLFDIYNDYEGVNNLKTINDNAGITAVEVDNSLIDLIEFCIDTNQNISDKVNIAMGPVLKIWHEYRTEGMLNPENAKLPPMDELQKAKLLTNIQDIIIDKANNTVFLKKKGMSLDVGAVAKGYATQLVTKELQDKGFTSFIISGGGNIKAVGTPKDPTKKLWGIGLQNPFYFDDNSLKNLIDTAFVSDTSVVTSGDYQRFYTVDGKKYHHLIDPNTLMPQNIYSAVTVMTEISTLADFLSTVLFITPYDEGRKLVDSLDGVEAYWIFPDQTIKNTTQFNKLLKSSGATNN